MCLQRRWQTPATLLHAALTHNVSAEKVGPSVSASQDTGATPCLTVREENVQVTSNNSNNSDRFLYIGRVYFATVFPSETRDCPGSRICRDYRCVDVCEGQCGSGASCTPRNHIPVCTCPPGYTGDALTSCRPFDPRKSANNYLYGSIDLS